MDLPTWAICPIVTVSAPIGWVFVFLLCLVLALLIRWLSAVREPPPLVLVATGLTSDSFRRGLFRRAPRPAPELVRSEAAAAFKSRGRREAGNGSSTLPSAI
jgi:hypothetical protein